MRHSSRFALLACLYVTQYLPIGFFFIAMPAILRAEGFSLTQIGAFYVVALPWVFKAFWAPLVDRYRWGRLGHYRGWLLVIQSLMVLNLLAMLPLSLDTDFSWIVLGAFVYSTLSATQDIAADATAFQVLSVSERGLGNGVQMAGGFLGSLLGGGVSLVVYDHLGWSGVLLTLAGTLAAPLVLVWRYREPGSPLEHRAAYRDLWSFFRRRGISAWITILVFVYAAVGLVTGLIQPMLVDADWSLERIGFVVNIFANGIGILGAMLTGAVMIHFGRRQGFLIAFGLQSLFVAGFLPLAWGYTSTPVVLVVMTLFYLTYALTAGCISTLCMDRCRATSPGNDFTVQNSVNSLLGFICAGIGTAVADSLGYAAVIGFALVWAFLTFVLIARLLPGPTVASADAD